jgi:hypothetical protein
MKLNEMREVDAVEFKGALKSLALLSIQTKEELSIGEIESVLNTEVSHLSLLKDLLRISMDRMELHGG